MAEGPARIRQLLQGDELEGSLELTERSESNLLDKRDQLLMERDEATSEVRALRAELEAEGSKGFWTRLAGG